MRVCRAMAMFRPTFIALIKNLTPEDLVFMEICFQRTVLVNNSPCLVSISCWHTADANDPISCLSLCIPT